jgi:hypothetical protein
VLISPLFKYEDAVTHLKRGQFRANFYPSLLMFYFRREAALLFACVL